MRLGNRIAIACVCSLALAAVCPAAVITVCWDGSGDYTEIQPAIVAASAGDVIVVCPGTYNETIDFLGKSITVRSSDGPDVTIIDGVGLDDSVVKCISGEGLDTVLEGFTVTGGLAAIEGGGMVLDASSATIRNCAFVDNTAIEYGGGVICRNGSDAMFVNCAFTYNQTGSHGGLPYGGGGMYIRQGSPTLVNCFFGDNFGCDNGGGMFILVGNPMIVNCLFTGNTSGDGGGMQICNDASPVIINSTFSHNSVLGGSADGGGIRTGGEPIITNCIFWGNFDGGGTGESAQIYVSSGTVDVTYSCIQGCTSFCSNPDDHNIGDDPQFRNAAAGDLRLLPASDCIDAGNTTALPPDLFVDLDGNGRRLNNASAVDTGIPVGIVPVTVDMGAYEFHYPVGDINGDGAVNAFDIDPFVELLTGG